jgi:hypothetical protein
MASIGRTGLFPDNRSYFGLLDIKRKDTGDARATKRAGYGEELLSKLSADLTKRPTEALRSGWSVRQLDRQIVTPMPGRCICT